MTTLALLLIGYSLFSAFALAVTHFRRENYSEQASARTAGLMLLGTLSLLQLAHWGWLYLDRPWVAPILYRMMLFAVAPCFYLFSRPLLKPSHPAMPFSSAWPHGLPFLAAAALPLNIALPLAFVVGTGYLVWLGQSLYALRQARANFQNEITLLGAVFLIALAVSLFGILRPAMTDKLFFTCYATAIGLAFLLVQIALSQRPHLQEEVVDIVQTTYANSTLTHVDCEVVLLRLEQIMREDTLYRDADLDLAGLAGRLAISPHQLSELLNSKIGKSFSRYLREQRVAAAKVMLLAEPKASVLSVGLSVGFTSQSNFYEAFRDLEGMTPGQYRKLNSSNTAPE